MPHRHHQNHDNNNRTSNVSLIICRQQIRAATRLIDEVHHAVRHIVPGPEEIVHKLPLQRLALRRRQTHLRCTVTQRQRATGMDSYDPHANDDDTSAIRTVQMGSR